MIDYNGIYNGLFDIVSNGIGQYLSRTSGDLPMIYPFADGGEYGTYPYVLIERGNTLNHQGTLNFDQYIDDAGNLVTISDKSIIYFIRVMGSNALQVDGTYRSASELASVLEGYIRSPNSHKVMTDQSPCSAMGEILNNIPNYKVAGDQIYESANLSLIVNTKLVHTQENPDTIETINLSADVNRHSEDEDPFTIVITAESNQ